jgi:hypothetical protein
MLYAGEHYELESQRAFDAAERAATLHERIRLLESARIYAQMAAAERRRSNVYAFQPVQGPSDSSRTPR